MKETRIDTVLKRWILPNGANRAVQIRNDIDGHLKGRKFEKISKNYYEIFGVIDAKASTLLTHISMMIAANAVLLSVKSEPWLDLASIVLLLSFIVVALLTLRLLRFWAEGFEQIDQDAVAAELSGTLGEASVEMKDIYNAEICYRDRLYKICLNLTTSFTFLSIIPIVGYLLDRAGKLL